ncbi:MAG: GAF domain-containing protein [Desulfobacteraceae bacterium]|nr:MAG: GAF domain-containing protein [Desulfobacteraceae bacterium]
MALKKLIGEILSDLGFVTPEQIEAALQEQRKISKNAVLPEKLDRARLVSEARLAEKAASMPFLGQLLYEKGYITKEQLDEALAVQDEALKRFHALASTALCSILDIGAIVNSSLNLVEVLSLIMKNANKVTQSVASTLMLVEETTGDLVFSVPTGPTAELLVDNRIPRGKGIAGWVAEHEQTVVVPDAKQDPRFYSEVDKITGAETRTILAVPLKAKAKLIGVLEVINKSDGTPFTDDDALLLSIFASQAAMAIENARLYGELKDEFEKRSRMERELAEVEKFRALGQLSSGIAHDFNNFLGGIKALAEISMLHPDEPKKVKQSMEQILQASNRARELVSQILVFSRQGDEEKVEVSISQVVMEAVQFIRATLPSSIDVRLDVPPDSGTVLANPTQIHQVLMNLCINSSHAMNGKGVLKISLRPVETESAGSPDSRPFVKLDVTDSGCGMDDCTIKQAFEPYFTTKEKGFGTGLGLAVVHGIVKGHGGSIRVFSEPGKGTSFEILLPRIR